MPSLEEVGLAFAVSRGLQFEGPVGAGAFKETFSARADGAFVAIKVFRTSGVSERAQREIDAMRACNHKSIATISEICVFEHGSANHLVIVEPFLEGGTLEARLQVTGPLQRADAVMLGRNVIEALDHLRERRLVHRDIKPANIMFDGEGRAVLVDLGLVRNLGEQSLTQTWVNMGPGTPLYAPPEQLLNEKHLIDWRSDQFSLAVTVAIAMTGRHPYQRANDDPGAVVANVASRIDLPSEFIEWSRDQRMIPLQRMLQPWPHQRYRFPADLAADWNAQSRE